MTTTLYIGNTNYSSWSFRAWLTMKQAGMIFDEVIIPLRTNKTDKLISEVSPSKTVPCLHHNGKIIWDSLAICEYINELYPQANLYPEDTYLRAIARSVCSEMHSSFIPLRSECPMDIMRNEPKEVSDAVIKNLTRIDEIWSYCFALSKSSKYLFGDFGIADAFFAPVVSRIVSYQLKTGNEDYIKAITSNNLYQEWCKSAIREEKFSI